MIGLQGMAIAGGLSAIIAFGAGWTVRDAFCDAAEARAELAAEKSKHDATKLDLQVANLSAADSAAALEAIARAADAREEILRAQPPTAPVRCPVGDAGLQWLRRIAPD